jgi:hypothetical protein
MAALDDRPRPDGNRRSGAKPKPGWCRWACQKAKDLGYPHELWTTRMPLVYRRSFGHHADSALLEPSPVSIG